MQLNFTGALERTTNDPLALGEFSDFYIAKHNVPDLPEFVAIKAFRGSYVRTQNYIHLFTSRLNQCVERWKAFDHQNIAQCYGYALDCGLLPALVMRHYPDGNVVQYVSRENPSFDDRLRLVLDIAQGLKYLHTQEKPIVHGDLRGANVFVNNEKRAVIADYELGQVIEYRKNFTTIKPAGPTRWTAPELTSHTGDDEDDGPHFTAATDIFAFAMTVIEIFTGNVPFATRKQDLAILRIIIEGRRPDIPEEISHRPWFSNLLQQCWDKDPAARPTAAQVVDILTNNFPSQPVSRWWSYYIPGVVWRLFYG
ncbi:hypothetical protein AX14_013678 [Amanita brunnescens Koide BX004]|nr:hypothetical protein AX14_013678 [Amanita brunnescens Koide BX004]